MWEWTKGRVYDDFCILTSTVGWMASVIPWAGIEEHSFGIKNENGYVCCSGRVCEHVCMF